MSKAYKCEKCNQLFEGMTPTNSTHYIEGSGIDKGALGDSRGCKFSLSVADTKDKKVDLCHDCIIEVLLHWRNGQSIYENKKG